MPGFSQSDQDEMQDACDQIARILLRVGHWKTGWRSEVDGCVFKIAVKGYPKKGTPRHARVQAENDAAVAALKAEFGDNAELI